ncbi:MAG: YihY/virulence factor BrkB family protein [Blastocatellia bacterium]|nr:YihY/virulence factor BrkB family protein [Blastocatellia bacterium]
MFDPNYTPKAATPLEPPPASTAPPPPQTRGVRFYVQGGWLFFKKMWPALYDLSTNQTYVYASAIAFNALMSFFSFIVLLGSILVNVFHWQRGYETIYRLMFAFVPVESRQIFDSLDQVTRGKGGEVGIISFALLLIGSAGVFQALEIALNHAWGFKEERGFLKQYSLYPLLVFASGAILMICVGIASVWDGLLQTVFGNSIIRKVAFNSVSAVLVLPFLSLILFLIYYWVPNGKVRGNQVAFASIAMAILWVIGSLLYQLVLPLFKFQESYGQLFGIMAIVTWILLSSFLLILGESLSQRNLAARVESGVVWRHFGFPFSESTNLAITASMELHIASSRSNIKEKPYEKRPHRHCLFSPWNFWPDHVCAIWPSPGLST